jgi:hypothetical protein
MEKAETMELSNILAFPPLFLILAALPVGVIYINSVLTDFLRKPLLDLGERM